MNGMADIVQSGLPWHIVLYGDELGTALVDSHNPIDRKFWSQKTVAPFQEFPTEQVFYKPKRKLHWDFIGS